jgi:hypothetical protein
MSYLRTVVTYHQPSEAEVDKAYLESHGHNVCLLNANTARNELHFREESLWASGRKNAHESQKRTDRARIFCAFCAFLRPSSIAAMPP